MVDVTACRFGAPSPSGFLAGRVIVERHPRRPCCGPRAVDRLKRLAELVDGSASPWQEAAE
jgi:hypothetical protein